MKEKQLTCSVCGAILTEKTKREFDGQIMCEHCLDEQTTICECCNERIWRDNAESDGYITICYHCYEYSYHYCAECGRLIHSDDTYYEEDCDEPYCEACYNKLDNKPIHSYCYKPEPIFYGGSGTLFYGVELEIDNGGECDSNAEILLDIANTNSEHIYCKHDGSIDNGFEIVSHPMTLDYHISDIDWLKIFNRAVEMGYRSHNTSTCGLHIHVSRAAFGKDHDEQETVIARIVHFVEKHWWEIVKFSRRTEQNLNRWAARYATISAEVQDTYKKAKDKHLGRYVAVNLENYNTIEFRLFSDNTIWLVKGDSPLSILHFPDLKLYVYASTEEILWKALVETDLFCELKNRNYEEIELSDGEILNILSDGTLIYDKFDYTDYSYYGRCHWWDYGNYDNGSYIDELKSAAAYQGYSAEEIDELLAEGFTPEEIEDFIYCCE